MEILEEEWVTLAEAAALLKVSLSTVRRWIDQRELPCYRFGHRRLRVNRSDLTRVVKPGRDDAGPYPVGPLQMTRQERDQLRQALRAAESLRQRIPQLREDKSVPPSYRLINQARNARSQDR